jgi:hypothetical protein
MTGPPAVQAGPGDVTAPDTGGSYVGFADVGLGAGESEIVPDRFDEAPRRSPSTLRLRRDEILSKKKDDAPRRDSREAPQPEGAVQDGDDLEAPPPVSFVGEFESQFDLQDPVGGDALPAEPVEPEAPEWTPPPEAPPTSTWETEEPRGESRPEPPAAVDGGPLVLTAEALDLIAEKVVQRMSDRVVREIAWEVIPEVVETIVRRRIKELEDKPAE